MAIAVLTADPEFEQSVKATFGANAQIDLTLVTGALAGREDKLDFAGARVVVLDVDASQDAEVNALQRLMLRASNWPPVIVVTQKFDQDFARALMQMRVADFLVKPLPMVELVRACAKVARSDNGGATTEAQIYSLLPASGGVGVTTLAIQTAMLLLNSRGSRMKPSTCLVDLDFQHGNVSDYLDLEPRLNLGEIEPSPERLDRQLLEVMLSHHSSGLAVVAAPHRPAEMRSFDPEVVTRLLDLVSSHFEYVVFDMPRTWFSWTDSVLLGSNKIYIVSEATVPGLRHSKELIAAIKGRLGEGLKPQVLVNRFASKMFSSGLRHADLEQVLGEVLRRCDPERLCASARSDRPRRSTRRGQARQPHHAHPEEAHRAASRRQARPRRLAIARQACGGALGATTMTGRFSARRIPSPELAPSMAETVQPAAKPAFELASAIAEPAPAPPPQPSNPLHSDKLLDAKVRLHRRLIEEINLSAMEKLPQEEVHAEISKIVGQYVLAERLAINAKELEEFISEIMDEMTGLGPLEPLLKDPTISDILINGHECIYVERRGLLEPLPVRFKDEQHLLRIINKIVAAVGRRVDESHPLCDARLLDGSRVNVAVRPVGVDGPLMSIRKFSKKPFNLNKLVEVGALRPQMAEVLAAAVRARITTIISGGTGSGKTTMLNALSAFISEKERLITIEDAAELQLQQPHVGRMETRPPNTEGKGEIRQRELVKNALRMRPDRIILGECRGEEAFDMLQAMNTGHEGSMATVHANTPRDAISRLEQMIGMAGLPMTVASIRGQIANAIQLIVQLQRGADGKRKVTSIAEVTGMEGDIIQMQEIFKWTRTGTAADGTIEGNFQATGVRPRFLAHLLNQGVKIPGNYFDPTHPL